VGAPDQIQSFLDSVQHDRFAALFLLEPTTGIRRGQVCGLRWSAVDLDAGEITCTTTGLGSAGLRVTRPATRQGMPIRPSRWTTRRSVCSARGVTAKTGNVSSSGATIVPAIMSSPSSKDNDSIAAAMHLSVRTVERHLSNCCAKLGVGGKSARAAAAARLATLDGMGG
jgi:integrase